MKKSSNINKNVKDSEKEFRRKCENFARCKRYIYDIEFRRCFRCRHTSFKTNAKKRS